MAFRFLHLADVHLDIPFGEGELAGRLNQARRESFRAAVDAAVEEQVHAFLIAGDLFHSGRLTEETACFLLEELARLRRARIRVFYARGNHDPAQGAALTLPEDVEIFDDRFPRLVEVRDERGMAVGAVAGAGYARAAEPENLALAYPRRHPRLPTVGLLHTQLVEEGGAGTAYAPVSLAQLDGMEYDYWALGHIHRRQEYSPRIQYPGCLMACDWGDRGIKGALLVEVSAHGLPNVRFLPLAKMQLTVLEARNLAHCATPEQVAGACAALLEAQRASGSVLARITLGGEVGCARTLTGPDQPRLLASMAEEIRRRTGAWFVQLIPGELASPRSAVELRQQPDFLGEVLAMAEDGEKGGASLAQILDAVKPMGLAGCRGAAPREERDYVRELLGEIAPMAPERLRREKP